MRVATFNDTQSELAWWVAIGALATWLTMQLLATPLYGAPRAAWDSFPASPSQAPRLLPELAEPWAIAVDDYRCGDRARAREGLAGAIQNVFPDARKPVLDAGLAVWNAILLQANGEWIEAIAAWQELDLPLETRVWRFVAIAAAHMEEGRLDDASIAIDRAWSLERDNPLVRYYTALLYLDRARESQDWNDARVNGQTALVTYTRPRVVPNSLSMYRLAASAELENAIELAGEVNAQLALIPNAWTGEPDLRPLVHDLLSALGAVQFEGTAHHMLGDMMLERGSTELSEEHFDAADQLGVKVLFGYGELAESYERQGRHFDAARAYAKELQNRPGEGSSVVKLLENLMRAPWSVARR